MKLYNANLSPNALRVRAVANELDIPLEIIDVDLRKGGNKAPDFLAINPNGKVPVLVDGDFVLVGEPGDQRLSRGDETRTRALSGRSAASGRSSISGPTGRRSISDPRCSASCSSGWSSRGFGRGEPDEAVVEGGMKEVAQLLPVLDANLAGKEWVTGALSLADFAVASTLVYAKPAGISLAEAPNIPAWMARMEARPSWQAATAPIKAFLSS